MSFTVKRLVHQQGVALAIVVWFIAAMSLLVAGIVSYSRTDVKMAQIHIARATAVAAGDGAINVALAKVFASKADSSDVMGLAISKYMLGNTPVKVRLIPSAGLIDLNGASQPILAVLFEIGGGLTKSEAVHLARAVVKWREKSVKVQGRSVVNQFNAIEDLLRVEGVTRTVLDRVRNYIVAGSWAQGSTDGAMAPELMMKALGAVSPGKAAGVQEPGELLASSPGELGELAKKAASLSGVVRADALLSYGGATWLRRRWVLMSSFTSRNGLPWRVVRTEPPRIVTAGLLRQET